MLTVNSDGCAGKLKFDHPPNTLGSLSLLGLAVLGLGLVCPVVSYGESAEALVLEHREVPAATISLSLPSTSDIDITPTSAGQFGAISSKLQIESSSNSGYQVYVSTMDQTNAMVGTKGEIKALTQPSTSRSFLPNTWGYALNQVQAGPETEYQGLPLTPTVAHSTNQATTGTVDTYYLSFGTKIDTSLPAGQYTNNVVISAIANPQKITNLSELTYMQDMTSSICQDTKAANGANTVTPGNEVEKRLIDARDGKEYWVSKLADQNCWMVQNLALDLSYEDTHGNTVMRTLTSADSDISEGREWRAEFATEYGAPNQVTNPPQGLTKSWNMGQYVLATPLKGVTCNVAPTIDSTDNNGYNSVRPGQTLGQNCVDFQDVSGTEWQPAFVAQNGVWNNQATGPGGTSGIIAVDKVDKTYDAHYLIGNYYPQPTATANSMADGLVETITEGGATFTDAKDSICPKGWTLPTAGRSSTNKLGVERDDSFYKLLRAYGYPASEPSTVGGITILNGVVGTGADVAYQNLARYPIRFVRSGYIYRPSGSLRSAGFQGMEQSKTYMGYNIQVDGGAVHPSTVDNTSMGFGVRCLAK